MRVAQDFSWRSEGPIHRRYGPRVLREFLHDRFDGERTLLRFEVCELSDATFDVIRRKLQRRATEITEMAERDAELPSERKPGVGVALALRPWTRRKLKQRQATFADPVESAGGIDSVSGD
ncbi:MAG TPA: hypothetical protein VFY12_03395 [Arenimonas sp.]|nr:hypothetical protein [Arenimonas sp.]